MDCCRSTIVDRLIRKLKDFARRISPLSSSSPKKYRIMRNTNVAVRTTQQRRPSSDDTRNGFLLESLGPHHRSTSIYSLSEQIDFLNSTSSMDDDDTDVMSCGTLAKCIEETLRRQTKSGSVGGGSGVGDQVCSHNHSNGFEGVGEVLVPADLTLSVAECIVKMADEEPCGIRGCVVYIMYEDADAKVCRRVGKVRCDPNSVITFEVTLTLRPDNSGWLRLLPPLKGCLKKFRNGFGSSSSSSTLVLSPDYTLSKNKLYRSNQL